MSSAATTSAPAISCASRGAASRGSPMGVAARTRTPGGSGSHPRILSGPPVQSPAAHPALARDGRAAGVSSTTSRRRASGSTRVAAYDGAHDLDRAGAGAPARPASDATCCGAGWHRCSSRPSAGSCGSGSSAGRTSWSSTRPTTSSRPGRCCSSASSSRVPDTIKKPDVMFTSGTPDVFGDVPRPGRAPAGRQVGHRRRRAAVRA